MNNKRNRRQGSLLVVFLVLFALLLAGCGLIREVTEPDVPPTATPTPSNGITVAQQVLAQQLGVPVSSVTVVTAETVEWPDSCLGIEVEGQNCAQVVTPGYRVLLEAQGNLYQFHTNETGGNVRLAPTVVPSTPVPPTAVIITQQRLAQQLDLASMAVTVVSADAVDWPDSCLGAPAEGEQCAQVITPGYQIILEAQGQRYEYHTDESGSLIRLVSAPEPQVGQTVIHWSRSDGTSCQEAVIGTTGVAFGLCGGALLSGRFLSEEQLIDLTHFTSTYVSFQGVTPAGTISFAGQGVVQPTTAEQRAIAEWTRLIALEAITGEDSAPHSVAYTLRQEGGLAGICNEIAVHLTGVAWTISCQANQSPNPRSTRLSADQLAALYTWVDLFQSFEWLEKDPATADALTIRLAFNGQGQLPASDRERQAMQALALSLQAQANTQ